MDRWSTEYSIVTCLKKRWNPLHAVHAEESWQMELFCIMTMLDLIQQYQPVKWVKNRNSNFSPIQHTVHISPSQITKVPDHSESHYVDSDLQTMKKVQDMVHTWLHTQPETFFTDGITKLMDWHNKCMEKLGGLCQKKTVFLFMSTFCRIKKIRCPYFFKSPNIFFDTKISC
jgi:hypothetical protein